jgi:hypothetical protein
MGNGSPRLLGKVVSRTAAVALASLALAPSAFAGNGALGVTAPVVPATVPVSTPAVPAPAAPVVDAVATAVSTSHSSTGSRPVATGVASPSQILKTAASSPSLLPKVVAAATPSTGPSAGAGSSASAGRSALRRPSAAHPAGTANRRALHVSSPSILASPPKRGSSSPLPSFSRPGASDRDRNAAMTSGREPATPGPAPELPQIPSPLPAAFSGGAAGGATAGLMVLLLALAAELAILATPGIGRKVSLLLAAPRPHPYLLRLERPDYPRVAGFSGRSPGGSPALARPQKEQPCSAN